MSDPSQTLQSWARGFRDLANADQPIAQQVAKICKKATDEAISKGESLDGEKWPARVKDGGKALQTAGKHIQAYGQAKKVTIVMTGGPVFSQFGTHRQAQRAILPTKGLPKKLGSAIRLGVVDMGMAFMTRKGRHDRGGGGNPWMAGMTSNG